MDIAKNVFQLPSVDPQTGEVERMKLKRDCVALFSAKCPPGVAAFKACGSARYWGRTLTA